MDSSLTHNGYLDVWAIRYDIKPTFRVSKILISSGKRFSMSNVNSDSEQFVVFIGF